MKLYKHTIMYISVKADSFIHVSAFISMCRVIQSCFKNYQKLDFAILHSKYTYLGHFYEGYHPLQF